MKLTHPLADRDASVPGRVTVNPGQHFDVDEDGTVDVPEDIAEQLQAAWQRRYGVGEETDEGDLPVDPSEHNVDELPEKLESVDDVEVLEAIRDIEAADKDRDGAYDAIDDRIADLQEE